MKHKKNLLKSDKARVTGTILKEFCSSKINGLVMKNFFREIVTL
jgi:hypothetical protein